MRSLTFLFLISFTTAIYSQSYSIIDQDSKQAIEGVIVEYGKSGNEACATNSEGKFTIAKQNSSIMLYIHCMGYKAKSMLLSQIGKDNTIALELAPIELNAFEIDNMAANRLLTKAIYNTKKKLVTKKKLYYLLHIIEEEKTNNDKQELYAKYACLLEKNEPDKKKIPFKLNLIDLKHIVRKTEETNSNALRNNTISTGYQLDQLDMAVINKKYTITLSSSDDDPDITLTCIRKKDKYENKTNIVYSINKLDTTLNSINYNEVNSEDEPFKRKLWSKFKRNRVAFNVVFKTVEDNYYVSKALVFFDLSYVRNSKEENLFIYTDVKMESIDGKLTSNTEGKKLNGYTRQLFRMDNTSENIFW